MAAATPPALPMLSRMRKKFDEKHSDEKHKSNTMLFYSAESASQLSEVVTVPIMDQVHNSNQCHSTDPLQQKVKQLVSEVQKTQSAQKDGSNSSDNLLDEFLDGRNSVGNSISVSYREVATNQNVNIISSSSNHDIEIQQNKVKSDVTNIIDSKNQSQGQIYDSSEKPKNGKSQQQSKSESSTTKMADTSPIIIESNNSNIINQNSQTNTQVPQPISMRSTQGSAMKAMNNLKQPAKQESRSSSKPKAHHTTPVKKDTANQNQPLKNHDHNHDNPTMNATASATQKQNKTISSNSWTVSTSNQSESFQKILAQIDASQARLHSMVQEKLKGLETAQSKVQDVRQDMIQQDHQKQQNITNDTTQQDMKNVESNHKTLNELESFSESLSPIKALDSGKIRAQSQSQCQVAQSQQKKTQQQLLLTPTPGSSHYNNDQCDSHCQSQQYQQAMIDTPVSAIITVQTVQNQSQTKSSNKKETLRRVNNDIAKANVALKQAKKDASNSPIRNLKSNSVSPNNSIMKKNFNQNLDPVSPNNNLKQNFNLSENIKIQNLNKDMDQIESHDILSQTQAEPLPVPTMSHQNTAVANISPTNNSNKSKQLRRQSSSQKKSDSKGSNNHKSFSSQQEMVTHNQSQSLSLESSPDLGPPPFNVNYLRKDILKSFVPRETLKSNTAQKQSSVREDENFNQINNFKVTKSASVSPSNKRHVGAKREEETVTQQNVQNKSKSKDFIDRDVNKPQRVVTVSPTSTVTQTTNMIVDVKSVVSPTTPPYYPSPRAQTQQILYHSSSQHHVPKIRNFEKINSIQTHQSINNHNYLNSNFNHGGPGPGNFPQQQHRDPKTLAKMSMANVKAKIGGIQKQSSQLGITKSNTVSTKSSSKSTLKSTQNLSLISHNKSPSFKFKRTNSGATQVPINGINLKVDKTPEAQVHENESSPMDLVNCCSESETSEDNNMEVHQQIQNPKSDKPQCYALDDIDVIEAASEDHDVTAVVTNLNSDINKVQDIDNSKTLNIDHEVQDMMQQEESEAEVHGMSVSSRMPIMINKSSGIPDQDIPKIIINAEKETSNSKSFNSDTVQAITTLPQLQNNYGSGATMLSYNQTQSQTPALVVAPLNSSSHHTQCGSNSGTLSSANPIESNQLPTTISSTTNLMNQNSQNRLSEPAPQQALTRKKIIVSGPESRGDNNINRDSELSHTSHTGTAQNSMTMSQSDNNINVNRNTITSNLHGSSSSSATVFENSSSSSSSRAAGGPGAAAASTSAGPPKYESFKTEMTGVSGLPDTNRNNLNTNSTNLNSNFNKILPHSSTTSALPTPCLITPDASTPVDPLGLAVRLKFTSPSNNISVIPENSNTHLSALKDLDVNDVYNTIKAHSNSDLTKSQTSEIQYQVKGANNSNKKDNNKITQQQQLTTTTQTVIDNSEQPRSASQIPVPMSQQSVLPKTFRPPPRTSSGLANRKGGIIAKQQSNLGPGQSPSTPILNRLNSNSNVQKPSPNNQQQVSQSQTQNSSKTQTQRKMPARGPYTNVISATQMLAKSNSEKSLTTSAQSGAVSRNNSRINSTRGIQGQGGPGNRAVGMSVSAANSRIQSRVHSRNPSECGTPLVQRSASERSLNRSNYSIRSSSSNTNVLSQIQSSIINRLARGTAGSERRKRQTLETYSINGHNLNNSISNHNLNTSTSSANLSTMSHSGAGRANSPKRLPGRGFSPKRITSSKSSVLTSSNQTSKASTVTNTNRSSKDSYSNPTKSNINNGPGPGKTKREMLQAAKRNLLAKKALARQQMRSQQLDNDIIDDTIGLPAPTPLLESEGNPNVSLVVNVINNSPSPTQSENAAENTISEEVPGVVRRFGDPSGPGKTVRISPQDEIVNVASSNTNSTNNYTNNYTQNLKGAVTSNAHSFKRSTSPFNSNHNNSSARSQQQNQNQQIRHPSAPANSVVSSIGKEVINKLDVLNNSTQSNRIYERSVSAAISNTSALVSDKNSVESSNNNSVKSSSISQSNNLVINSVRKSNNLILTNHIANHSTVTTTVPSNIAMVQNFNQLQPPRMLHISGISTPQLTGIAQNLPSKTSTLSKGSTTSHISLNSSKSSNEVTVARVNQSANTNVSQTQSRVQTPIITSLNQAQAMAVTVGTITAETSAPRANQNTSTSSSQPHNQNLTDHLQRLQCHNSTEFYRLDDGGPHPHAAPPQPTEYNDLSDSNLSESSPEKHGGIRNNIIQKRNDNTASQQLQSLSYNYQNNSKSHNYSNTVVNQGQNQNLTEKNRNHNPKSGKKSKKHSHRRRDVFDDSDYDSPRPSSTANNHSSKKHKSKKHHKHSESDVDHNSNHQQDFHTSQYHIDPRSESQHSLSQSGSRHKQNHLLNSGNDHFQGNSGVNSSVGSSSQMTILKSCLKKYNNDSNGTISNFQNARDGDNLNDNQQLISNNVNHNGSTLNYIPGLDDDGENTQNNTISIPNVRKFESAEQIQSQHPFYAQLNRSKSALQMQLQNQYGNLNGNVTTMSTTITTNGNTTVAKKILKSKSPNTKTSSLSNGFMNTRNSALHNSNSGLFNFRAPGGRFLE